MYKISVEVLSSAEENNIKEIKSFGFSYGESFHSRNLPKEDCSYPLVIILYLSVFYS